MMRFNGRVLGFRCCDACPSGLALSLGPGTFPSAWNSPTTGSAEFGYSVPHASHLSELDRAARPVDGDDLWRMVVTVPRPWEYTLRMDRGLTPRTLPWDRRGDSVMTAHRLDPIKPGARKTF
jgi:hypothetical protein